MKELNVMRLVELLELNGERNGARYWARCRSGMHEDRNPSWMIWVIGPKAGLFHCFSCKWSGYATQLVMRVKQMNFHDAEDYLSHLETEKKIPPMKIRYRPSGAPQGGMTWPDDVVQAPFEEWIPMVRQYVLDRNISPNQSERWGLAYAVCGRLAGRIVIPVYNRDGLLLNYTARTFVNNPKRYLMPDSSEKPDESAVFGEQFWIPGKALLLAEGAINAMALERVADPDFFCIGALMGSHISPRRALKLMEFEKIFLFTDPDMAGNSAAQRVDRALGQYRGVVRVELPEGKDAADLKAEELAKLVEGCQREVAI